MIEVLSGDDRARLVLADKIRVPELGDLAARAREIAALTGDVELDLGASEHLHAAALQILVALRAELEQHGRHVHVTAMSDAARDAFALAGLTSWSEEH